MGMAWVGEHDSPRGAPRNKDGTVSQLTYRFSGKLRKRFYEDASLESVHLRKARRQRAVAQTEAKLERSAWRTHKARLRVRNLRETRALGILSVNLKSYVIKRRKHAVATKYQSRVASTSPARIVRRLFAMRTSALLLQAQWRGIRSRSEIRHLRLVNIVAEGYVEQICLYAMARLYQRRILPQIASGVIQRKWHRYRARRDALEARAKKSRGSAAMRSRAYQSIQRDSGGAGGANVWERHRASMAQSMANLAKTDAEQREKARKTLKSPGSSALMQRTAIQSLTFVRPRRRGGGARAVSAPIIDMTPITASDLILTPATGEAANYAPPPPPFISAEFFDLLNPEEIESLEMMRKQKLAESREETLRSEGSKVMMTRTMARRPSNVGAGGPGLDKDGLDKQKSFRNDRLVSLRKASLHALNFSGRGGLRPGGGRRMSASGLSLSEGGAGGARGVSAAEGAAPPPDELLATSVESDAATAAAPAAAPAPAARAAPAAATTTTRRAEEDAGMTGSGRVTDRANGGTLATAPARPAPKAA
ncbi:hypothetical protein JL721_11438 [Aureococcus anophagefferens]|nr:hypothetical protein JL721_11438 [Aureococcus anophagefferens]